MYVIIQSITLVGLFLSSTDVYYFKDILFILKYLISFEWLIQPMVQNFRMS